MPNIYADDVVRYFRRKSSSGFDEPITWLGAEQRNITALRNSGANNLEEQSLLGTDAYTELYEDINGNVIVEKYFHVNNNQTYTDYYKLISTVYKEAISNRDVYFDGSEIVLPDDANKVIFGNGSLDYPDLNSLYGVDSDVFSFVEESIHIYPSDYQIIRQDQLFFITNNGNTVTPVATKLLMKKYMQDSGVDKIVFKEDIINHLR